MKGKNVCLVFMMGALAAVASCIPLYQMVLQGSWEVDEYYMHGENATQYFYLTFTDYVITFHPDGYFTETYKALNIVPVTNSGTWSFMNNGQQLRLVDKVSTRIYEVKSLTKAEIRLCRALDEGGYEDLVLEPKEAI